MIVYPNSKTTSSYSMPRHQVDSLFFKIECQIEIIKGSDILGISFRTFLRRCRRYAKEDCYMVFDRRLSKKSPKRVLKKAYLPHRKKSEIQTNPR